MANAWKMENVLWGVLPSIKCLVKIFIKISKKNENYLSFNWTFHASQIECFSNAIQMLKYNKCTICHWNSEIHNVQYIKKIYQIYQTNEIKQATSERKFYIAAKATFENLSKCLCPIRESSPPLWCHLKSMSIRRRKGKKKKKLAM